MPVYRVPVTLTWDNPGSPGVNVWHLRTVGDPAEQIAIQDGVDQIRQFYQSLFQEAGDVPMRAGLTATCEAITNVVDQEQTAIDWTTVQSSSAEPDAPMALQICVGWRTSSSSRRGRGRTFVGPLNQGAIDTDGTPTGAAITACNDAAQELVTASDNGEGWSVGVYGLQTAGGGPTAPHVLRDLTGFKVRDTFAILRSRRD